MATESPGEAHAGDGVDLTSGGDSDTATDASPGVVGGDTDDEVPEGENYFGRASKEGAPPAFFVSAFVSGAGSPAFRRPSYALPLSSAAAISRARSNASSFSRAIRCASTIAFASAIWVAQSSSGAEDAAANGFAPAGAAPSFEALPK